jgi:hypothetical protein
MPATAEGGPDDRQADAGVPQNSSSIVIGRLMPLSSPQLLAKKSSE